MLYDNKKWDKSTTGNVYKRAADVIRERGWCQATLENDLGHVCLLGALLIASYGTIKNRFNRFELPSEFYAIRTCLGYDPTDFNDASYRKVEDVLDLLEKME